MNFSTVDVSALNAYAVIKNKKTTKKINKLKKTTKLLILILIVIFSQGAYAQVKVGSNPTIIDSSAIFEIESTTLGFLPPRMSTIQRNAIQNPVNGLLIYNTNANCLQVNTGSPSLPFWVCTSGINRTTGGTSEVSSIGNPCASSTINGIITHGVNTNGVTMTLNVNVTQLGTWNIIAGPINGVTFSGSGTFSSLGCQSLTLTASGIPTASGSVSWTTNTMPSASISGTINTLQVSSGGSSTVSSWSSTIGCAVGAGINNSPAGVRQAGVEETMVQGLPVSSSATISLIANVTTVGTYNVSTNTVNGVSFSANGTFTATGNQTVTLTPSGTPMLAGNYMWTTNRTPNINVYGSVLTISAPLGSSYNAHFNGCDSASNTLHSIVQPFKAASYTGGDIFTNNTTCQSKPISAQGCGGITSITSSSGRVHNTININGQCWLTTNMNIIPSVYSTYTTSYWTASTPDDQGYWGYYNDVTTDGTAGWKATEPATNEGYLYQWCGAMDATISERSRGICPAGFHVPSDCEWMYLEHGQGMSITEQNIINGSSFRANNIVIEGTPGNKLRSQGTGQTNASGFSGLLTGLRGTSGVFGNTYTSFAYLWSSSASSASSANARHLASNRLGVDRRSNLKANSFSLRCLKD